MSDKKDRAASADRELVITRTFDAPCSLVYKSWTEPGRMAQWSCPRGFKITHQEGEVRPGAAWRTCMRSAEGKDLWLGGVYREVVKDERLVFTHAWDEPDGTPGHETLVTVLFEDIGGKTKMVFRQALFATVEDRNGHEGGWNDCFDKLDALLAAAS